MFFDLRRSLKYVYIKAFHIFLTLPETTIQSADDSYGKRHKCAWIVKNGS